MENDTTNDSSPDISTDTSEKSPQNTPTKESRQNDSGSFLDTIIATSNGTTQKTDIQQNQEHIQQNSWDTLWNDTITGNESINTGLVQDTKKTRKPVPPSVILKAIGSLLFAVTIVFASFLAYIVFHPQDAQFFVSMFGINTADVADLLQKLINGSFGIILFVLSIGWIISLFRALWVPEWQKRKKLVWWMIAWSIGILLFSLLAFWSFLFKKIGDTVWDGWRVSIFDNALYNFQESKPSSEIKNTQDLIGPITLRFDISNNARDLIQKSAIKITGFELNFDWALCTNTLSVVSGKDPLSAENIICTFDRIKTYNIRWSYEWQNSLWEKKSYPIDLSPIILKWLIEIKEQKNTLWNDIITLNASSLRLLWTPKWIIRAGSNDATEDTNDSVTFEPSTTPFFVALKLGNESGYERIFPIQKNKPQEATGSINVTNIGETAFRYQFELRDTNFNKTLITHIDWIWWDGSVFCRNGWEKCEYTFGTYWSKKIQAIVYMANRETHTFETEFILEEPILLARHVQVNTEKWIKLNTEETFDPSLKAYVLKEIIPPETVIFDARDVVSINAWYKLKDVKWTIFDGKNTQEKQGEYITFDVMNTLRYVIRVEYSFEKNSANTDDRRKTARDTIIIDVEHKLLIPKIFIQKSSDYVPARITVDGSQSRSEIGEIKKFIYNFGEWRPDAIGDAIQTYEYTTPGEKEITLTIVSESWEKAQVKKLVVLKETPRVFDFSISMSPAVIQIPVDFTIANENGQIEDYVWNFWDNTPSERGSSVTHTYSTPGNYVVSVFATYSDGTLKQIKKNLRVETSLD
jgi:PKD repeat protein